VLAIAMGKVIESIGEQEEAFIVSQKVFFVATAPISPQHHISVSPKSQGCVVLDPHTVAYADLTGSGAETAAHVLQNGRMTLMFCNIESGPPKILRLFGKAEVIMAEHVSKSLRAKFPVKITNSPGFRAVYKLRVHRISSSCGYSMPVMKFEKYRDTLNEWTEKKGKEGIFEYHTLKNSYSIDGLPSLALLREESPSTEPFLEEGYVRGRPSKGPKHGLQLNAYDHSMTTGLLGFDRRAIISMLLPFILGMLIGRFTC
jgi:hypothetical protein